MFCSICHEHCWPLEGRQKVWGAAFLQAMWRFMWYWCVWHLLIVLKKFSSIQTAKCQWMKNSFCLVFWWKGAWVDLLHLCLTFVITTSLSQMRSLPFLHQNYCECAGFPLFFSLLCHIQHHKCTWKQETVVTQWRLNYVQAFQVSWLL